MAEDRPRFLGVHEHGIDDKGRMVLPAKIRAQLGPTAFLAKLDRCIGILTREEFDRMTDRYEDDYDDALDSGDAERIEAALRSLRRLSGDTAEVTPDQQGRIVIPAVLRRYADLQDEVVTVGVLRRAEIWNRQRWQDEEAAADEDLRANAATRSLGRRRNRDRQPEAQ